MHLHVFCRHVLTFPGQGMACSVPQLSKRAKFQGCLSRRGQNLYDNEAAPAPAAGCCTQREGNSCSCTPTKRGVWRMCSKIWGCKADVYTCTLCMRGLGPLHVAC